MKGMNFGNMFVKSRARKYSCSESSYSDEETVRAIRCTEVTDMGDSLQSGDTSHKKRKRRKHHHPHHKRTCKGEAKTRERSDDVREERIDEHHLAGRQHCSRRRHGTRDTGSEQDNVEDVERYSCTSGHKQHRDDKGDRIRHVRREDGESYHGRDGTSHTRRSNSEPDNRDRLNMHHNGKGENVNFGRKSRKYGGQSTFQSVCPVKQEQISEENKFQWGKQSAAPPEEKVIPQEEKAKPNFGLSGKLAEDTNTFNGVVLKYSEPQEARKPKRRWRFYPFKGDQGLPTLYLHRQSCYLIGRDRKVADIPVDHPSCSKQHAALQYRLVPYTRDDGSTGRRVRPYLIDLESANGTYVNNNKIEPKKYVELLEKDVVKFGYSSREYVLLHEQSREETLDDDISGNTQE